jgi:hypothetical protein
MPVDVASMMNRYSTLAIEGMAALSTPVTADSVPFFFHQQEGFPYFIHRLGNFELETTADEEWGEEMDALVFNVTARLVIGHLTSDYKGLNDANLQLYVPHLIEWYNEHENLRTATSPYTSSLDYLIRSRCVGGIGYGVFDNRAVGVQQVGAEFNLRAEFAYEIVQQYLR